MQLPKLKLNPMQVPWGVSPTPHMQVCISEDETVNVEFIASVLNSKDEDYDTTESVSHEERIVLTFPHTLWTRVFPAASEEKPLDDELYDQSELNLSPPEGKGWLQYYREKWIATGVSPDPRFYLVSNSSWIPSEFAFQRGYRHYLIVGDDMYVDVFAKEWNWRSEGPVVWTQRLPDDDSPSA